MLGLNSLRATRDSEAPDRWGLFLTRVGVPLIITVAGIVLMVIGHGATNSAVAVTGLCLVGVAIMVWMLNWMYRLSLQSNREREVEEQARDFFTLHGYWPGEKPE
jgi:threonine/homoserine/homoserine lactone efflux protein